MRTGNSVKKRESRNDEKRKEKREKLDLRHGVDDLGVGLHERADVVLGLAVLRHPQADPVHPRLVQPLLTSQRSLKLQFPHPAIVRPLTTLGLRSYDCVARVWMQDTARKGQKDKV